MSASAFFRLRQGQVLEAKHEAAREMLAVGVATGGTQQQHGVSSYGLPPACAHYLDLALSDKADELNAWATQRGSKIVSTSVLDRHPQTFRLEAGSLMATPDDYVAVVLPLSATAAQVEIKAAVAVAVAATDVEASRATTTTTTTTWEPEAVMLVEAGQSFSLVEGSTHFVYVLVRVERR